MKNNKLKDAYREVNGKRREYTFVRTIKKTGKSSVSRLDTLLMDKNEIKAIQTAEILEPLVQTDHRVILFNLQTKEIPLDKEDLKQFTYKIDQNKTQDKVRCRHFKEIMSEKAKDFHDWLQTIKEIGDRDIKRKEIYKMLTVMEEEMANEAIRFFGKKNNEGINNEELEIKKKTRKYNEKNL